MKKTGLVGVCLFVLVTGNHAGSKDDPAAIIARAIKAHGSEKTAQYAGLSWKAKGKLQAFGTDTAYTIQYTFGQPDKLRFDMKLDIGGKLIELTVATDGKTAWEQSGDNLREMDKKKMAEFQHTVYTMNVTRLINLKDKAFTLKALGESKVNGKPAVGVQVSRQGKRDLRLFFDKETGLLAKAETRVWDEFNNQEVTQEAFFSGYRDKDGGKVFDRLILKRDGKPFIEEGCSDMVPLKKVEAKQFSLPGSK